MLMCRLAMLSCCLHVPLLLAQNADILAAIKDQAFNHSRADDDVFYLADVFGPRFMDSSGYVKAGEWAVDQLQAYGLAKVTKEYFPTPGPGWEFSGVSVEMISPAYSRMGAFPLARSRGSAGVISGEPVAGCDHNGTGVSAVCDALPGQIKGQNCAGRPDSADSRANVGGHAHAK